MDSAQVWIDNLYRKHAFKMMNIAYRILKDRSAAEDVVQNVFIILIAKHVQIRNEHQNPEGWLYVTLRNQIGNELQRLNRRNDISLDQLQNQASKDSVDGSLEHVLPSGLKEGERQLLLMHYDVGLSYEEIAEKIGCSVLTCRTKMCRARAHFKQLLAESDENEKNSIPCNISRG